MHIALAVVGALFAIFVIIILHELGHFLVAKACGIKVIRFSIGFGKALFKRVGKTGTEYVIAILPLGGYVKMLEEGDPDADPQQMTQAFSRKPLWARMAVVLAGPAMNILIAIVVFWMVFMMGTVHVAPIIGQVTPKSIAQQAGVQKGDELLRVGNTKTQNWQRVLMALIVHMGERHSLNLTLKQPNGRIVERTLLLNNWQVNRRKPDFFKSLGFYPYYPRVVPIVHRVLPNTSAAAAGLKAGDRIIKFNQKPVRDWHQLVKEIRALPDQQVTLTVQRNKQHLQLPLRISGKSVDHKQVGFLGVTVRMPKLPAAMLRLTHHSFFSAWWPATQETWLLFKFNVIVLAKMIAGKISVHTLGGPITVFQAAGEASLAGLKVYLKFIGLISITVAFINLLPIPGLDGGHFLFQIIEAICRRPVPQRYQMISLGIGMALIFCVMVQATINDILRFFG